MSKSDYFENALMSLIFQGTAIDDIAENDSSSPATALTLALHTADPGESGDQTTNEATYTGYARQSVSRNSSGWSISGNVVSLIDNVVFPVATAGSETLTHYSIGTGSSDRVLYYGVLDTSVAVVPGVQPRITAGTVTEG